MKNYKTIYQKYDNFMYSLLKVFLLFAISGSVFSQPQNAMYPEVKALHVMFTGDQNGGRLYDNESLTLTSPDGSIVTLNFTNTATGTYLSLKDSSNHYDWWSSGHIFSPSCAAGSNYIELNPTQGLIGVDCFGNIAWQPDIGTLDPDGAEYHLELLSGGQMVVSDVQQAKKVWKTDLSHNNSVGTPLSISLAAYEIKNIWQSQGWGYSDSLSDAELMDFITSFNSSDESVDKSLIIALRAIHDVSSLIMSTADTEVPIGNPSNGQHRELWRVWDIMNEDHTAIKTEFVKSAFDFWIQCWSLDPVDAGRLDFASCAQDIAIDGLLDDIKKQAAMAYYYVKIMRDLDKKISSGEVDPVGMMKDMMPAIVGSVEEELDLFDRLAVYLGEEPEVIEHVRNMQQVATPEESSRWMTGPVARLLSSRKNSLHIVPFEIQVNLKNVIEFLQEGKNAVIPTWVPTFYNQMQVRFYYTWPVYDKATDVATYEFRLRLLDLAGVEIAGGAGETIAKYGFGFGVDGSLAATHEYRWKYKYEKQTTGKDIGTYKSTPAGREYVSSIAVAAEAGGSILEALKKVGEIFSSVSSKALALKDYMMTSPAVLNGTDAVAVAELEMTSLNPAGQTHAPLQVSPNTVQFKKYFSAYSNTSAAFQEFSDELLGSQFRMDPNGSIVDGPATATMAYYVQDVVSNPNALEVMIVGRADNAVTFKTITGFTNSELASLKASIAEDLSATEAINNAVIGEMTPQAAQAGHFLSKGKTVMLGFLRIVTFFANEAEAGIGCGLQTVYNLDALDIREKIGIGAAEIIGAIGGDVAIAMMLEGFAPLASPTLYNGAAEFGSYFVGDSLARFVINEDGIGDAKEKSQTSWSCDGWAAIRPAKLGILDKTWKVSEFIGDVSGSVMKKFGIAGRMRIQGNHSLAGGTTKALAFNRDLLLADSTLSFQSAKHKNSWDSQHGAEKAIDGNTDGRHGNLSVTHTKTPGDTWWQGDFGALKLVNSVTLYNRTDCCGERLSNFYLLVSDIDVQGMSLERAVSAAKAVIFEDGTVPTSKVYTFPEGTAGRFITIYKEADGHLSLAEVIATGSDSATYDNGIMIDDAMPEGAINHGNTAYWNDHTPVANSGDLHVSDGYSAGTHQFYITGLSHNIQPGDSFSTMVVLPENNFYAAKTVQFQLQIDGTWYRVHWGQDLSPWPSHYEGELPLDENGQPLRGEWFQLSTGLNSLLWGKELTGIAWTIHNGGMATFDRTHIGVDHAHMYNERLPGVMPALDISTGKPAMQWPAYHSTVPASNGNDGVFYSETLVYTDLNHTGNGLSWWEVDLGSAHTVQAIDIQRRYDGYKNQSANIKIEYLDANDNDIATSATIQEGDYSNNKTSVVMEVNGVHKIRVQRTTSYWLSFEELTVWGNPE